MILGPISLLDCVIFVVCLIPNLLITAGPVATISLVKVIPFLGMCSTKTSGQRSGAFR
jgi:hypothetical protein